MAQPKPSVDGSSDLSVSDVYDLDFFPEADSPLVDEMLHRFPPVSLLQELKSARFDDTFKMVFPNPPFEISENMKCLRCCKTQHVECEKLKDNSDQAIECLKLLYSAFRSSDSDVHRSFTIRETSEIVLGNANIIFIRTCELLHQVEDGKLKVEQLKEFVSKEMNMRSRLDELQIQRDGYNDSLSRTCLQGLKAFAVDFERHLNHLVDSAVDNNNENAQLNEGEPEGFHAFRRTRRERRCTFDQLNRDIAELNDNLKAQANQDVTDTRETALEKLYITLEIMDLHLVYAFFFLTQLGKYALVLGATCQKFCSIALGDQTISEKCWKEFKYDILLYIQCLLGSSRSIICGVCNQRSYKLNI